MTSFSFTIDPIFGCHLWTGAKSDNGRPIVWQGRRPSYAYKLAYEQTFGPVPNDRVLDHLCRRVLCTNAWHLEPVTKSENELRKSWRYRAKRTHCMRGHELRTAMVTPEGGRVCRDCTRLAREQRPGVGGTPYAASPGGRPATAPRVSPRMEAQAQFPPRKGR